MYNILDNISIMYNPISEKKVQRKSNDLYSSSNNCKICKSTEYYKNCSEPHIICFDFGLREFVSTIM